MTNLGLSKKAQNNASSRNPIDSLNLVIDLDNTLEILEQLPDSTSSTDVLEDIVYYLNPFEFGEDFKESTKNKIQRLLDRVFRKSNASEFISFIEVQEGGTYSEDIKIQFQNQSQASLEEIIASSREIGEESVNIAWEQEYDNEPGDKGFFSITIYKSNTESIFGVITVGSDGLRNEYYGFIFPNNFSFIKTTEIKEYHKNNMKTPLYTYDEAKALTESLVDQDTKFDREVEALINTEEAKEILRTAYQNADDNAKMSIADATEQQFLDKYAPDGSAKDKDEKKEDEGGDKPAEDGDFLDDASGLEDTPAQEGGDGDQETPDADGSEDIIDDGGSEDDQDTGIGDDNIFAQLGSGDDSGELTAKGEDETGNPFLESKKARGAHSLNESRKAARMSKANKSKARKLNESEFGEFSSSDEVACALDDLYYGKIWKYLEAKAQKLGNSKKKLMYIRKVMKDADVAKGIAETIAVKLSIDPSKYGKNFIGELARIVQKTAGDQWDLGEF